MTRPRARSPLVHAVAPAGADGLARVAVGLALLTLLVRAAGFVRTLVFAGTVGASDLGDVYQTANAVPNLIVEVIGGAVLAVAVVPLLAGLDPHRAARRASWMLGWTLVGLVVVAAGVALAAEPIMALLLGHPDPAALATGARMLRVFAVQLPLYGAGLVLTGVLHARHRFAWPVLAPLLSSLVAIGVYLAFTTVDGAGASLATVTPTGEAILSVGTTLAVAVLTLSLVVPVRRSGPAVWPRVAYEPGLARRAVALAGAAVVAVAAQQVASAVQLRLANGGPPGSVVLLGLAQAAFTLPWAVLVVPWSTQVFPRLAESAAARDRPGFDAHLARAARAIAIGAGLGVVGLLALARPIGHLLADLAGAPAAAGIVAWAVVAFAPGLLGYAAVALIGRALIAAGRAWAAAWAGLAGWLAGGAVSLAAAALTSPEHRVIALAAANSVTLTLLAALLVAALRRTPRRWVDPGDHGEMVAVRSPNATSSP